MDALEANIARIILGICSKKWLKILRPEGASSSLAEIILKYHVFFQLIFKLLCYNFKIIGLKKHPL